MNLPQNPCFTVVNDILSHEGNEITITRLLEGASDKFVASEILRYGAMQILAKGNMISGYIYPAIDIAALLEMKATFTLGLKTGLLYVSFTHSCPKLNAGGFEQTVKFEFPLNGHTVYELQAGSPEMFLEFGYERIYEALLASADEWRRQMRSRKDALCFSAKALTCNKE